VGGGGDLKKKEKGRTGKPENWREGWKAKDSETARARERDFVLHYKGFLVLVMFRLYVSDLEVTCRELLWL
jgi:hypothetical protein